MSPTHAADRRTLEASLSTSRLPIPPVVILKWVLNSTTFHLRHTTEIVLFPCQHRKNRMILLGLMSSAGWDFYDKEWWHYQLFNPRYFPLLSDRAAGTRLIR